AETDALSISVWMILVPAPGGLDDGMQIGVAGLPAELGPGASSIRDQLGRVARAASAQGHGNFVARHSAAFVDYFTNAVPPASAQIQFQARSRLQAVQGQDVGRSQVVHVDVVADAGAVGR